MNKKLISLLLTIVMLTSAVFSSYAETESISVSDQTVDRIADKGEKTVDAANKNEQIRNSSEVSQYTEPWKEYVGDIETFVYGLIISQLEYSFDVFPGCVDLPDGDVVYGIAYTDYSNCYTNEDETVSCFDAGFIPFNGELAVSQEDFDYGLNISNLDFTDDQTSFIWAFGSDSFRQHCVVYDQYLQYGIDDNGAVFFEASHYIPGVCDESIGSLYSYDEAKYLLDYDVGTYIRLAGVSLFNQLDFDELEKEINRVLMSQDKNFSAVDIVSCANFSQKAIISYLLSLQEETFLGFNVNELVEAANSLDPMECYRITADGLIVLKLEDGTKASDLTKWLVGTGCVILMAVAMVGSVVFIECPGLSALSGAVAGTAIEIFMQVVISEKDLNSVDWRKVALGAAAGAVSGFLGPYVYASCGGFAYFALDSAMDGLIGGIERAAEAWMDGSDAENIMKSFGTGFALGFALSAGFKGLAAGISKVANKVGPGIKKAAERYLPKVTKKISAMKQGLGKAVQSLKKAADASVFHSQHLSKKIAEKQIRKLLSDSVDELMDNSLKRLSVDDIYDVRGNKVTKGAIKELAAKAKNGAVLGYFKKGDDLIRIVKQNNVVGIVFDSQKYQSVFILDGLTDNRSTNFNRAAELFRKQWVEDSSKVPKSLATIMENSGMSINTMKTSDLVNIIKGSDWVMHENIDRLSITLVPRALHEGVKHSGGVSLAKYIKSNTAIRYFDQLISAASTGTVIAAH